MSAYMETVEDELARLRNIERAVNALVGDTEDGALLTDIARDRFALVRRFRAITRAKLDAQKELAALKKGASNGN